MDIHVNRNGQGFGPYEANEAKSLYARGNIAATDLVWHEGMTEWQTAGQLFGERPMPSVAPPIAPPHPVPPRQAPPVPGFEAPRSSYAGHTVMPETQLQSPPKLHWALVLLFGVLSFGIFIVVWMFMQSTWVRKINPQSNATNYLIGYVALAVVGAVMGEADSSTTQGLGTLLQLASYVLFYCGYYSMRRSMIDYFNKVEPIGLRLSGAMTFFFSIFYLQHHMTRIAEWKKTGNITPQ